MRNAGEEQLISVSGIGKVLADAWMNYFSQEKNNEMVDRLLMELTIKQEAKAEGSKKLEGMVFVITGSVEHFENRKALQEAIEAQGGKATGSVTSNTTYLINNDTTSNSSKNKKAKELGVPIISEEEFIKLLEE
jgi:DNA ligase (NAD+)